MAMRKLLTLLLLGALALPAAGAMEQEAFLELCGSGSAAAVKEALKKGAKVNVEDEYGFTPLVRAAMNNPDPEVVRTLIEADADIHVVSEGGDVLQMAARSTPAPEVIKILIDAGLGEEINEGAMTPLMLAALENPHPAVIRALVEAGADVNAYEAYETGRTALIIAAQNNPEPGVILALLDAGAEPGLKDGEGRTALDYARANEDLRGTEALRRLEAGTK